MFGVRLCGHDLVNVRLDNVSEEVVNGNLMEFGLTSPYIVSPLRMI